MEVLDSILAIIRVVHVVIDSAPFSADDCAVIGDFEVFFNIDVSPVRDLDGSGGFRESGEWLGLLEVDPHELVGKGRHILEGTVLHLPVLLLHGVILGGVSISIG